jgi:acyl-coenzyme A synthetase/AMP-(fatty) acid ligase
MPAVFVPTNIIMVEALPTNATGKIDRQGLKHSLTTTTLP